MLTVRAGVAWFSVCRCRPNTIRCRLTTQSLLVGPASVGVPEKGYGRLNLRTHLAFWSRSNRSTPSAMLGKDCSQLRHQCRHVMGGHVPDQRPLHIRIVMDDLAAHANDH